MAIRCSSSAPIIIQKSGPINKPISKVLMLKHGPIPVKKTPKLEIRSSLRNKVFEDRSKGIVCYRDDSGEIICEGYDEGPRLHQLFPRTAYHLRDAEIVDLLQQSWLHIVRGNHADKGVAVQEDVNWNGYNTFS
ncbi:hypothetical protein L1049_005269 [Liquidambar formosana]|uniref:Uncharacterized protein n=1 Tax=Liquidambar formosana TaxID=63359 RepID=A0AAP0WXI8_LIQFO